MAHRASPRSKRNIREFANKIRRMTGVKDSEQLNIISCLELFCSGVETEYTLEIVPEEELRNAYAQTIPSQKVVLIREDVYYGALSGNARDRFTLAHELGHVFLHNDNTVVLSRGSENIPIYENPEWQANTFAAEFLVPTNKAKNMNAFEIVARYNCSFEVACIQAKG